MGNLSSHEGTRTRELIEVADASRLYFTHLLTLDFKRLEKVLAKLKAHLREAIK
jgi:hypothetical protein